MMDEGKIKGFLLYQNSPSVSSVTDWFPAVYVLLRTVLLKILIGLKCAVNNWIKTHEKLGYLCLPTKIDAT